MMHIYVCLQSTCKDYPVPSRLPCGHGEGCGWTFLSLDSRVIIWGRGDTYGPGVPVVVVDDLPVLVCASKRLRGGDEENLNERNELAEDEPDVDVLDVGCLRQGLHHRNENCRQDQHVGEVHSQGRLKEKFICFSYSCIFKLFQLTSKYSTLKKVVEKVMLMRRMVGR